MSNILTVTAENQKAIASCRCAGGSCLVFHGPQHRPRTETRENICIMTMVNRTLHLITGHAVRDKTSRTIQQIVDAVSGAERYCTKVSMLTCAIISLRRHGDADAFPENWRISKRLLPFSCGLTFGLQKRRYRSRHPGTSVPFSFYDLF